MIIAQKPRPILQDAADVRMQKAARSKGVIHLHTSFFTHLLRNGNRRFATINEMNREVTVKYSLEILRLAVWKYWINFVGLSGFITLIALAAIFLYFLLSGDRSWLFGVILAGFVIYTGVMVVAYFRLLSMSMQKFRRMEIPGATWRFSDEGISVEADTGKTELSWKFIDKILQYPKVWLIVIAGSGYVTLPTEALDDELKTFILEKASLKTNEARQPPAHI